MSGAAALRIGMLAGEPSGDRLGAGLLQGLAERGIEVDALGVGGPLLVAAGLHELSPQAQLTMHGFAEPLRRLPYLWRLLGQLEAQLLAARIDVFVGVDFNVFNLLLERRLKRRGIATVHYVSPSVYAWRRGRVRRVAASADLLLTLFPFEPALYAGQSLAVRFVGHPLADEIAPPAACPQRRRLARAQLALDERDLVVAVLPGSRRSEVAQMLRPFLSTAVLFHQQQPAAQFLVPCVTPEIAAEVRLQAAAPVYADVPLRIVDGGSREVLAAADLALVKSGTSTLEALLYGVPMVVGYRLPTATYLLVKALLRSRYVALPNILANDALVPELLQHDLQPAKLVAALQQQLNGERRSHLERRFAAIHRELRCGASANAAAAVCELLDARA